MARRFFLILGVALVIGVVTGSLVYRAITSKIEVQASIQPTRDVAVAAANINLGETLTNQHVKLVPWPKDSAPAGALGSVADVEGRVALTSIIAGEPLFDSKLATKLAGGSGILPMLVPENFRGVTIKVDDAVRESGFVSPNSRVDVVVSIADKQGSERTGKVILQNVPVLAAGQSVEMRNNKPVPVTTVTLALTPEQVERLAVAQTEGRLMLATRNLTDNRVVQTPGTNVRKLLGDSPAPAATKPAATRAAAAPRQPATTPPATVPSQKTPPYTVTVFHGSRMTEHHFVQTDESQWVEARPAKTKSR